MKTTEEKWVAFWMGMLAIAVLIAGCDADSSPASGGGLDHANEHSGPPSQMINPATPPGGGPSINLPPITDVNEVFGNTNRTALSGRAIRLDNVTVQRVLAGPYFLVGEQPDRAVPVRLHANLPGLQAGQKVRVSGIVGMLGEDLYQWQEVKAEDRELLKGHLVLIQATDVKKAD